MIEVALVHIIDMGGIRKYIAIAPKERRRDVPLGHVMSSIVSNCPEFKSLS
jgi:hypothetical protein